MRISTHTIMSCAEGVSRTRIACSSDRCLDHLGYLSSSKYFIKFLDLRLVCGH